MNVTWGPGSWRRWQNDVPAEWCSLCGTKVGADRLIQSDVEGLRGAFICDLHPNERQVRDNESFLDLGGIGQVPDSTPNWYPHSGVDGFDGFLLELAEDVVLSTGIHAPADVIGLSFDALAGKTYAVKVDGTVQGPSPKRALIGIGGTVTTSAFRGEVVLTSGTVSAGSVALSAIGSTRNFVFLPSAAWTVRINATVTCSVSGTVTVIFGTPGSLDSGTLKAGCTMLYGEVDA